MARAWLDYDDAWVAAHLKRHNLKPVPGSEPRLPAGLPVQPLAPETDDTPVVWLRDIPQTLPASTTEAELRAVMRKVALLHGWKHFHVWNSEHSERGWPDDVLTNGRDILAWELKMKGKKATPAQEEWLSLLAHTGKVECGVKYPQDWPDMYARLTRKETP